MLLWVGCMAGGLEENEYREKLAGAGFEDVQIEPTWVFRAKDALSSLENEGIDIGAFGALVDEKIISAFIRARKPLHTQET